MPFMQPQYLDDDWCEVDTCEGLTALPVSIFGKPTGEYHAGVIYGPEDRRFPDLLGFYGDYLPPRPCDVYSFQFRHGIGCRLSAPGYMDCTEWAVHATEEQAREHLSALYDVDPDTGEDLD